tara:strand:+ start:5403 stop:6113 length:711 start_codon:yes stop_codon:yes gene_type:complete
MVEIQIQENKYEIPTEWKDITLEWWCGLYTIIKKHTKMEVDEKEKNIKEEKLEEIEVLRMNRDIFKYLTGVNDNMLNKLDIDSVNRAVTTVSELLQEYKPKGIEHFEFEDETYYFPKEFLKRNTFGDYIEATQLDATIEMMKHGKFDVLPEQMAILCRKATEEFDDDAIPAKADKFKKLTMDIVWEFSFFLTMQSVKLTRTFQTYLVQDQVEESKPVEEKSQQKDSIKNTSDLMVG